MKRLRLAQARGDLLETEKAMKLWGGVCANMRSKLLALPNKMATLVFSLKTIPEINARLQSSIYEVLNELSNPDLAAVARDPGVKRFLKSDKQKNKKGGKK